MTRTALACLMTVFCLGLAAAAPLAAQSDDQEMAEPKPASDWKLSWSNGFKLENPSSDIALKFGGRIQNDWAWYSADDDLEAEVGAFEEGTEFRRARLFFEGELYDRVEFKAQYDFAGGDPELKDVYLGLINLPGVGGLRVGHYKEPFSLEEQTSSKYLTFLERALPIEAFSPSRNSGFMLHDGGDRYTWAVGLFRDTDDFGDAVERDEVSFTGRVTGVPWTNEDGSRLLHLGLSASQREPTDDSLRFRSRPESHLAPRVVDTGAFGAAGLTLLDAEAALVYGPFSAQGEWVQASVDRPVDPSVDVDGFYVFGSWFLTGEHRPYDGGSFGRVKPASPWKDGGYGAWEIALRYSTLDLSDGAVTGGEVDDVTFGVNWYPFANVRWMANYVMSDRDGVGSVDAFQMRFQIDF
jgi:phosphate-selective porin OprO/OprP